MLSLVGILFHMSARPCDGFSPTDERGGFSDTSWVERGNSANRGNGAESQLGTERNTQRAGPIPGSDNGVSSFVT